MVKRELNDIFLDIRWAKVAQRYFERSPSWLYHKIDGTDGNGGEGGFSPEELEFFKGALTDLADRIRQTADRL